MEQHLSIARPSIAAVIAEVWHSGFSLHLGREETAFIAGIHASLQGTPALGMDAETLRRIYAPVYELAQTDTDSEAQRATHIIGRLKEQGILLRTDAGGLSYEGEYALSSLGMALGEGIVAAVREIGADFTEEECFTLLSHATPELLKHGMTPEWSSGKTTVMAAFVTAILPNQRLLAFKSNGATLAGRCDCGLWGRLGEEGVSYSLIEWITSRGKSVWAGVAMLRGAVPSIEIKNFIIEDLSTEASPHDVLLVREGAAVVIPQLPRLRDHVTLHGGRLTVYKSLNDYMKTLFDHGITPMPMTNHEEQERFYRVLSTSMEGSALASLVKTGLRDYLLAADASLERRTVLMRETLETRGDNAP